MNRRMNRLILLLALGIALVSTTSYGREEKKKEDSFTGVAVGTGGTVGGKSIMVDIRIKDYTTDEEVKKFAELLKEGGGDALRRALEKERKGTVAPVSRLGNDIAIARKLEANGKTQITIVTARILPFIELYHSGRSTDYQFGVMRFTLDEKGEGTGGVIAAAKISFNKKKGIYEVESFGNQYIKLANMRRQK